MKLTVSKSYYGSNGTVDGNNKRIDFVFFEGYTPGDGGKEVVYCIGGEVKVGTLCSFSKLSVLHRILEKYCPPEYWVAEDGYCCRFVTNTYEIEECGEVRAVSAAEIVGKGDWILSGSQFWAI